MAIQGNDARSALTHFKLLSWGRVIEKDRQIDIPSSLLAVSPVTGRRHQIRVHSSFLGHPIVGDFMYERPDFSPTSRMMLHAFQLEAAELGLSFTTHNPFSDIYKVEKEFSSL
jgi:23S rRNA-/tRNA-specific pseudouridylate synthase